MLSIHAKCTVHTVSRMLITYYSPIWQPDNQAYYKQILTRLQKLHIDKRPELWFNTWVLYYDHDRVPWWSLPSRLWETNSTVRLHTIPLFMFAFQWQCFFFFNKRKSTVNVQRFHNIKDVQKNVTAGLKVTQRDSINVATSGTIIGPSI